MCMGVMEESCDIFSRRGGGRLGLQDVCMGVMEERRDIFSRGGG